MQATARSFLGGALALIALYLIVAHAGGFSQVISSGTGGGATIFKTLQGR